jgi:tripartite-type tricarboxylate transporter receptor subunit TctC
VPGYDTSGWTGIGVPSNTPGWIIDKLNREVNAMLADRAIVARFADLGLSPLPGSPEDFRKRISNDVEKWTRLIETANIKLN